MKGWLPTRFPWLSDSYGLRCRSLFPRTCTMSSNIGGLCMFKKTWITVTFTMCCSLTGMQVGAVNWLWNNVGLCPSGGTPYLSVRVWSDDMQGVIVLFQHVCFIFLSSVLRQLTRNSKQGWKRKFRKRFGSWFVFKSESLTLLGPYFCQIGTEWTQSKGLGTKHVSQNKLFLSWVPWNQK